MITYNAEGVKLPKIGKRDTTRWIKAVAATHNRKVGEIGYMFVDDEKILEVNNEYLGHDYYTDIITFDGPGQGHTALAGMPLEPRWELPTTAVLDYFDLDSAAALAPG